jgi:hypothetical protein
MQILSVLGLEAVNVIDPDRELFCMAKDTTPIGHDVLQMASQFSNPLTAPTF